MLLKITKHEEKYLSDQIGPQSNKLKSTLSALGNDCGKKWKKLPNGPDGRLSSPVNILGATRGQGLLPS